MIFYISLKNPLLFRCSCLIILYSTSLFCQDFQPIIQSGINGINISLWVHSDQQTTTINSIILSTAQTNPTTILISNPNRIVISQPIFMMNLTGQGIAIWQSYDKNTSTIYIEGASYSNFIGWSPSIIISDLTDVIEPSNFNLHLDENGYLGVFWNILLFGSSIHTTIKSRIMNVNDFYK